MSDVFQASNGAPANFNNGTIKISVNGQVAYSAYSVGTATLGSVIDQIARAKGIRTFSVYADGRKLFTTDAGGPASNFKELDIVAKDSRG